MDALFVSAGFYDMKDAWEYTPTSTFGMTEAEVSLSSYTLPQRRSYLLNGYVLLLSIAGVSPLAYFKEQECENFCALVNEICESHIECRRYGDDECY